jgi:sirohydrochlorin cobaltochelatase
VEARILFCHGSRDPAWREPFDALVREHQRRFPAHCVRLAFLELMAPSLAEAIDELAGAGCDSIRIEPLFLAPGAHTRTDLPALVARGRQRWPQLQLTIGATLLEPAAMREAIIDSLEPLR